jgi:hypothetical protein
MQVATKLEPRSNVAPGRWKGRRPILVWNGRIVADIDVIVSERDPNSWRSATGSVVVKVRRV